MNSIEIIESSEKFLMKTYNRVPLCPVRGEGMKIWDAEGREYLDFVSGIAVCSLGHCHPVVTEAVCRQAHALMHVSNLYHIEPQVKLARFLVENTCGDRVFFCNSGAEANEAAIKLCRKWGKAGGNKDKYEIITALNSFHGRTLATVAATGQPKYRQAFEPLPEGFKHVPFNDLEALFAQIGARTCAVMLEPVQGEGGVNAAAFEYLQGARKLCDDHGLLLIFDEVQSGIGRTGKFLASQHYGIEPDIFTLAKGLGGGFPIGAMVARGKAAAVFEPGDHASTFGGNPLACAAALAVMEYIKDQGVVEHVFQMGKYLKNRLLAMMEKYEIIREVRGLGLLLGAELSVKAGRIVEKCFEKGLLINCVGDYVLRFVPPLTVSREDIDRALTILDEALDEELHVA